MAVKTPRQLIILALVMVLVAPAGAGPREQAKRLHDRLAGVPASASVLDAMADLIESGPGTDVQNAESAAFIAMDHPDFYRTTLKNFAAPWSNRDFSLFEPLNDYTATIIGMVRDDVDFRLILSGNIIYRGSSNTGVTAYSTTDNRHYEELERNRVDLQANLEQSDQTSLTGIPAAATAGVMTTRGAAKAFFIDGTNRAMFRFTLLNHLCHDLEQVMDITRAPDRIRQDVSRSPGGDSRLFRNNCIGCHSGMDPMAQAFAYYNFEYDGDNDPDGENGRIVYNSDGMIDPVTGIRVVAKYHFNENNFPYGFVTPNDSWNNYWRAGRNQSLGWDLSLTGSGSGAKSMGEELANSDAFAMCQVKKVFHDVCLRDAVDLADRNQLETMALSFAASGYKLKQPFAEAAVFCRAD